MKLREVEVWSFSLQQPVGKLSELSRLLSDEERIRADQFYFEELKRRYIVRHAFKRLILADYLGQKPQNLCFCSTRNGKPNLEGTPIHFNLSSSGDCAILACSCTTVLGVDVEEKRPMEDRAGIVNQFFSHREQKQWAGLADDQKDEAFFIAWTRKEAYVKALGLGLSLNLDSFSVSFDEGEETLQSADDKQANWRLTSFQATPLHRACVALPEVDLKLIFRHLA